VPASIGENKTFLLERRCIFSFQIKFMYLVTKMFFSALKKALVSVFVPFPEGTIRYNDLVNQDSFLGFEEAPCLSFRSLS
jgi:hypothetical protein